VFGVLEERRPVVPPPPAYTGQARQFRTQVAATEAIVAGVINDISRSIGARLDRGRTAFRPGALIDIERRWRMLPTFGRLGLHVERTKTLLHVREHRLIAATVWLPRWGADRSPELDITIAVNEMHLTAAHAEAFPTTPVCSVGLHSLARFWERAWVASPADAIQDKMSEILAQSAAVLASGDIDFTIETSSGRWHGSVVRVEVLGHKVPMLSARTFLRSGARSKPGARQGLRREPAAPPLQTTQEREMTNG
jgi:hypothetical protein